MSSDIFGKLKRSVKSAAGKGSSQRLLTILLLTNRNSDNVGDSAIEACDISLIKAAMKDLGVPEGGFRITSRDASIIPRSYVDDKDPAKLERARKLISDADVVMFGGAPLINYKYQMFYERTAATIEIAESLGKPVFFSSIGVESYDEDDPKCQRIKQALNLGAVKRISTRDGFGFLEKYKVRDDLVIDKAADPAVFAKWVFRGINGTGKSKADGGKKKIGIFVIRHNAFTDNGKDLPWRKAVDLWCGLAKELEAKGYDYEFLTSGHYADEAFLYSLNSDYGIDSSKCVTSVNTLEELIGHIADYDGVISCRLHPAILSFSMGVPSVGLIWNPKVSGFYESVGYPDRTIEVSDISPQQLIVSLEKAMDEGVSFDEDYIMSVYRNIYYGLKESLGIGDTAGEPYSFEELTSLIPVYEGTSDADKATKLRRKFRRIYSNYNQLFLQVEDAQKL